MRKIIPISILLAFAAVLVVGLTPPGAFAQSAKSTLEDPAQALRFNDISDRLVCQCGCKMILRTCNHFNCPSAVPMRKEIERQIRAGASDDEIVASFVTEYGLVVLSTPPPEGFNLAAWIMPGFAVLVGLFVIGYFIASWASKKTESVAVATPSSVDPEVASRIEAELERLEK